MVEYKSLTAPFEVAPPKYARLAQAVQERIENGTYPVGAMLPTEAAFAAEFECSRPTVVRALEILARNGWIRAQQGRGRFVLARRAAEPERRGTCLLSLDEAPTGILRKVGYVTASPRVQNMLHLVDGTTVLLRRILVHSEDGPAELITTYFPLPVVEGTALGAEALVAGGLRAHLQERKNIRIARAAEAVTARAVDQDEAEALDTAPGTPALVIWIAVLDTVGSPVFAVENVLLPGRRALEASYALS